MMFLKILAKIWAFLSSGYFLIPVVTLILSVCVWFFGSYAGFAGIYPLDAPAARGLLIAVLWIIALTWLLIRFLVRRSRVKVLEREIIRAIPETGAESEAVKAEMAEMRDKLREAMTKLRKSKTGRRSLYELPWYVMIGPPGAGKTTAIVNSGLQFPLADEFGKTAIGGVGGTRNCDWWFTDNAVLIDTAGRYTTQESDQESDNAAWLGFLALLKKNRKRQPINGAMIAISLSDLSMQDEQTQKGHARAVRRRLHELREKLGVRFPVYVLFTKADMIAGFTEYFDSYGKEEREQVWGFTLPLDVTKKEASPIALFDTEFASLLTQLNANLLERMQTETDHQRRSLIAGFPSQVASVRSVARAFLAEAFADNRFEERHMLRGVYFTSGTQEGTPIDRLMMGMARTFGIGRQAIGSGRGTGRSFFLTKLFNDVVFPEAGLVSADDKVERRYRATKYGAIAATILLAGTTGALWTRSYFANQQLMRDVDASITQYTALAAQIPGNPIGDTDLPSIVDALNTLRDMPVNPIPVLVDDTRPDPGDPASAMTWGLYQGDILANQAGQTYRAALNQHLLPRVILRVEEQLQGNINNGDVLYEGLKVYLMLGLLGPMDNDLIMGWMQVDWEVSYPGADRQQLRDDLAFHLRALLNQPMQKVELNGALVDQIQGILAEQPLAERVYAGIINSAAAVALPQWRLTEVGGPAIARAMVRSSGKPLADGIEGIFTYAGFNNVFKAQALGVAEQISRDSWVLGPRGEAVQTEAALAALTKNVLDLYYTDFINRYDAILGDIDIIPLESLSHAVEVTNILSGATSPIMKILTAVDVETALTRTPDAIDTTGAANTVGAVVLDDTLDSISIRNRMLFEALSANATANGEPPPPAPGAYVEERFEWLHTLVARPEGQPSQLDLLLGSLTEVYQELNRLSFGSSDATNATGGAALLRFQESASRIPGPLVRWSAQITTSGAGITADGTRAGINAAWQANVLPFCTQATEARYPFDRTSPADVGMADFQKLFGPGGLIDAFYQENLAALVDTRTRPWTWKPVNTADLGISPAVLAQFQAAAEIKEAFFATGPEAKITFQITPYALDTNATVMSLEIDGQTLDFYQNSGQLLPTAFTWPGEVGLARVGIGPPIEGSENVWTKEGPWGLFRLLDGAETRDLAASDRKRLIFRIGGRLATFDMQSGSVINPFGLGALSSFSCPSSL